MIALTAGFGWPFNGIGIMTNLSEEGFVVLVLGPLYVGVEWRPV